MIDFWHALLEILIAPTPVWAVLLIVIAIKVGCADQQHEHKEVPFHVHHDKWIEIP